MIDVHVRRCLRARARVCLRVRKSAKNSIDVHVVVYVHVLLDARARAIQTPPDPLPTLS